MKDDYWRWPEHDQTEKIPIQEALATVPSPYEQVPPPFCYPGTPLSWNNDVLKVVGRILSSQINHIGTHTHPDISEGGFDWSQKLEAQAVWMMASVIGGAPETVDGYFCGGATEANDQGIWIGREWLRKHPDPFGRGICVLTSPLAHYSIHKAVDKMDIGRGTWMICPRCHRQHLFCPDPLGRGITFVGMNIRGEMSVEELERIIHQKYEDGFRRFLIIPTVGTTVMGSVDPVADIANLVEEEQSRALASFYIHVDAAFGGFTVPFVYPNVKFGFELPEVMSVAIDGDKMGRLPYPAGIFLCRKDLQYLVSRPSVCVRGHDDDTFSGSRTALAPLLAWYQFRQEGQEGQRIYVQTCIDRRDHLAHLIPDALPWVDILPHHPAINILPLEIPINTQGEVPEIMREPAPPGSMDKRAGFLAGYHLRADFFPREPLNVSSCPRMVYKICVMPHTFLYLQQFVSDLGEASFLWQENHR